MVASPPKPIALLVNPNGIPEELKALPRWVVWRYEWRVNAQGEGKWTKPPYQALNPKSFAKSTDPKTWATFERAFATYLHEKFDGVGLCQIEDDDLVGIDLDHVLNPETGEIEEWASETVSDVGSYTERSPSGDGIRIYARGQLPEKDRKRAQAEIYSRDRYLTVTGQALGAAIPIRAASEAIDRFHAKHIARAPAQAPAGASARPRESDRILGLDDSALLEKARNARNGPAFTALFDRGDFAGDQSTADAKLMSMLGFWTNGDRERMRHLFDQSALAQREKWRDRPDYQERTLDFALATLTQTYTPPAAHSNGNGNGNGNGHKPTAHAGDPDLLQYPTTDYGNAERLAILHGKDLLYIHVWSRWHRWDGKRWRGDDTGAVVRAAKHTIRVLHAQAMIAYQEADNALGAAKAAGDGESEKRASTEMERANSLVKFARTSEASARIASMIELTRSEPGIPATIEDLDVDPWSFNVANGTVDLKTGRLRKHDRADKLTKITDVKFDPKATCPSFEAFLCRIFNDDEELIAYVQRAFGMALIGKVLAHVLFFLYGLGANGKSTLLETMLHVFGEYGKQSAPDLLVSSDGERHPTELADLHGARMVSSVEVESGRHFAEAVLKQATGGDRIKARYMRQDFFEFTPTHSLFLAANHKPVIKGTDYAIWRRIHLIPFNVRIPESEQDPTLNQRLRDEASGILNWLISGCLAFQKDGLGAPRTVTTATAAYRDESDIIGEFVDGECLFEPTATVSKSDLYKHYCAWCEKQNERPLTKRTFGERIAERGTLDAKGAKGVRIWLGVRIRTEGDTEEYQPMMGGVGGTREPFSPISEQRARAREPLMGEKADHVPPTPPDEGFPECPSCGSDEWTYAEDGRLVCSQCGGTE